MSRRTPQDKKALTLVRDRRNSFQGNDKASRTAIPARKRQRGRAERRLVAQQLDVQDLSNTQLEVSESAIAVAARKIRNRWKQRPDTPLREHIEEKLRRRA